MADGRGEGVVRGRGRARGLKFLAQDEHHSRVIHAGDRGRGVLAPGAGAWRVVRVRELRAAAVDGVALASGFVRIGLDGAGAVGADVSDLAGLPGAGVGGGSERHDEETGDACDNEIGHGGRGVRDGDQWARATLGKPWCRLRMFGEVIS